MPRPQGRGTGSWLRKSGFSCCSVPVLLDLAAGLEKLCCLPPPWVTWLSPEGTGTSPLHWGGALPMDTSLCSVRHWEHHCVPYPMLQQHSQQHIPVCSRVLENHCFLQPVPALHCAARLCTSQLPVLTFRHRKLLQGCLREWSHMGSSSSHPDAVSYTGPGPVFPPVAALSGALSLTPHPSGFVHLS